MHSPPESNKKGEIHGRHRRDKRSDDADHSASREIFRMGAHRLTHPLGQYVLDCGRNLAAPVQALTFHYGSHKPRISMIERLVGQSGWLQLSLLELDSFQNEEHLVFTAVSDAGEVLDQESCERLFYLAATTADLHSTVPDPLQANTQRQLEATLSRALE